MTSSLISILLPVRNAQPYLSACLDSIQAQTHTHWQLIAINDHSTDESSLVLERYAALDKRIQVLQATGKGIIEALRQAYAQSTGTYITRMDADDRMVPHKLATLYQQLKTSGKGHIATGLVRYFTEEGPLGAGYQRYAKWLNALTRSGTHYHELYKECVLPSPCWMLHRNDLEAAGAFASNRYPEDYDLCFRFYQQGLIILPSQTILHEWRDSSGRTSRHDPNYADNSFLPLKVAYFTDLHRDSNRPLVVWGAGKKGKALVQLLQQEGITPHWVCDNPNKIGHRIYDVLLHPTTSVSTLKHPQVIVVVAQVGAQASIQQALSTQKLVSMQDVFFFC